MAEMLKSVGYSTMAVGKWHLGDELEFLPTNQGFDSYYGIPYSNDMYPSKTMRYSDDCLYREGVTQEMIAEAFKKGEKVEGWTKGFPVGMHDMVPLMQNEVCIEFPVDQRTITQRFASEGMAFISESVKKNKPFFLYLANSMPHIPLFASKDFKGVSEGGLYGDTIEEIDHNVGRILDHLEELGIDEDTIVVFTSDNGPWLVKGEHGGSAAPLFEGKMTTFEGGMRVPAIIRWPQKVPAGSVCREMISTMDLMPTLAEITGAALPKDKQIDGKSVLHVITGRGSSPHEYFFYGKNAVRKGDWKYHKKEVYKVKKTMRTTKGPSLYHLKEDIGESTNLISKYPEIAQELSLVLEDHIQYLSK
jgi:arylsulfatase A-like enzyme